jgi:hypothetical protein
MGDLDHCQLLNKNVLCSIEGVPVPYVADIDEDETRDSFANHFS